MAEEDLVPVRLHPFVHQVGGHSTMLKLDEMTVCKPLVSREHMFYMSLPEELAEFVPRYKGSLGVQFEMESNGYLLITGYLPRSNLWQLADMSQNGAAEVFASDAECSGAEGHVGPAANNGALTRSEKDVYRIRVESTTGQLVVHDETIAEYDHPQVKLSTEVHFSRSIANLLAAGPQRHSFILLENLVAHYRRPCILDLKMGTRQHGDTDDADKIKIKQGRCQLTTSATLGFRVCGMQVYNRETCKYLNRDKYFGRQLTASGMGDVLRQFVHNGAEYRLDVVAQLVGKLSRFHTVVRQQDTFRFYSTSLLLMYDGEDDTVPVAAAGAAEERLEKPVAAEQPKVDVRIIDFAHVTFRGFGTDEVVHDGPDGGYLFGLQNLIRLLGEIGGCRGSTEQ